MKNSVSIIMACYNSLPFLDAAVESILAQEHAEWELIAVDDCSTDQTLSCLEKWAAQDSRISVFRTPENGGAGAARDFGISKAHGRYIAIMDGDDVALPSRLKKQLAFMQSSPEVVALGTQTYLIDEKGAITGEKTFPTDPASLYKMMYTAIPIQLPTLLVDTARLPDSFDWFEGWRYSEDSLLFFKLAQFGQMANLPEHLLHYRFYSQSNSYVKAKTYFIETWKARRIARHELGYVPDLRARIISGMQYLVVSCIPAKVLPGFYRMVRRIMVRLAGHEV